MLKTYTASDGPLRVLFVMATEAEYGAALRNHIEPVITGVGPVEAAARTARALADHPADLVMNLGSAGSRSLPQAGIFQVASVSYRDMDASPLGFEKGTTPFLDLPAEVRIVPRLPGIPEARLSTGGGIVNGHGYSAFDADMADMESFAVLRAAMLAGAGYIGLRGISDGERPIERFSDWTFYLAEIDARMAEIVHALPDAFAAHRRAWWKEAFA